MKVIVCGAGQVGSTIFSRDKLPIAVIVSPGIEVARAIGARSVLKIETMFAVPLELS